MTHHGVLSLFAPGGEGGASHGEWAFWAIRQQRGVKSRDNYELQGWRLHETCIPPYAGNLFLRGCRPGLCSRWHAWLCQPRGAHPPAMAVRAGRPSSGSGGLEAYAIPIFALIVMAWLVRRLGPLLAARISRLLVGEETPLDFANKGKLKGKKRVTKATPASALLRSPTKKSAGSPSVGAASSAAQEEVAPVAASKATGPASYQESAVAPLAAVNDQEAQATAKARNDSVEWTVNESKKLTRLS